jgi:hypothetical protein
MLQKRTKYGRSRTFILLIQPIDRLTHNYQFNVLWLPEQFASRHTKLKPLATPVNALQ